jgi:hypothetical protein
MHRLAMPQITMTKDLVPFLINRPSLHLKQTQACP